MISNVSNQKNRKNRIISRVTGSTFINSSAGFSLVELIVVIAIMGIVVTMSSIGLSILNGREASRCATVLDDAIKDARMITMTKQGQYSLHIKRESGNYIANLVNAADGSVTSYNLEGSGKTIKSITVGASATEISETCELILCFDATKGNVITEGSNSSSIGGNPVSSDEVMVFTIAQLRGDSAKVAKVSLVPATGKHAVGTF